MSRSWRSPMSISVACLPSGCGRARSATAPTWSRARRITVALLSNSPRLATAISAFCARSDAFPSSRRRNAARRAVFRGVQHTVARSRQRLRATKIKKVGDRRLRRTRLHAGAARRGDGDGCARSAARKCSRLHAAGLRHERKHQGQRLAADARARRHRARNRRHRRPAGKCSTTSIIPPRAARRFTTRPTRMCRRARARRCCFVSPTAMARSSSAPAICRSSRSAGAPMASAIRCRITTSTPPCRRR